MLEKNLNDLNIFALRDFARRTGVSSPTSKKKEELIKEIKEIISGEKRPEQSKSKQGRPPKVFGYNFANVFNANSFDIVDISNQTLKQVQVEYESGDMVTVAGWLELVNNNSALLWVNKNFKNENYFVPSELLSNLHVKMGDRVVAEVSLDENVRIVKKIFNINACPVLQLSDNRECYENIAHKLPTRMLKFSNESYDNLQLKCGENIYLYGTNNNNNTVAITNLLNSCAVENKIYINVTVAEKNKIFLSELDECEKFVCHITDEIDTVKRIVYLATERAKRLLENGEDVVVTVDDISSIVGIDKDGLNLVKNLVSITKEGNPKGSITLLAVMPNNNINQIEKLADVRLKIVGNEIQNYE